VVFGERMGLLVCVDGWMGCGTGMGWDRDIGIGCRIERMGWGCRYGWVGLVVWWGQGRFGIGFFMKRCWGSRQHGVGGLG